MKIGTVTNDNTFPQTKMGYIKIEKKKKKTGERFYLTWLMHGISFFFSQSNTDAGAPAWGKTTRPLGLLTVVETDKVLELGSGRKKKNFFPKKFGVQSFTGAL